MIKRKEDKEREGEEEDRETETETQRERERKRQSKMGNTWLLEYWKTGLDQIEHREKKRGQQSSFCKGNGKLWARW